MAAGKYNVAFTYNSSKEKALSLQEELDSRFGGVFAIECDVTDPRSVLSAVETAKKRFGKIDILVNNAGIAKSKLLIDTSLDEFKRIFDVTSTERSTLQKPCFPICCREDKAQSSTCRPSGAKRAQVWRLHIPLQRLQSSASPKRLRKKLLLWAFSSTPLHQAQ